MCTSICLVNSNPTSSPSAAANLLAKFIEACMALNASIFEPFFGEDDKIDDKSKYKFLGDLNKTYQVARRKSGNQFYVEMTTEYCKGCSVGYPIMNFNVYSLDTKSMVYDFGFKVVTDDQIVNTIQGCFAYKEHHPDWIPF
jgi:hypothetical protein